MNKGDLGNIFFLMKRQFKRANFLDGAKEIDAVPMQKIFIAAGNRKSLHYDRTYLALTESNLKDLVAFSCDPSSWAYNSNGGEFPDCDDFAIRAYTRVKEACVNLKYKMNPAFGFIEVHFVKGSIPHLMNVAVTAEDKILLYEPQTGTWQNEFSHIEFWGEIHI